MKKIFSNKIKQSINKIFLWTFSVCLVFTYQISFAQGVGISEASITPDASSILELRSTLRGFLPPRLTTVERDAVGAPVTGLFLYNTTTNRFNYRNAAWLALVSATDNLSVFAATTSAQLSGILSDETGTGLAVFATSPSFTTPTLGAATATSINNIALTNPGAAATLTLASGSTLVTSGAFSTTLTSTALTSVTLPTSGTIYGTAAASITSANLLGSLSDETGTGLAVFATSPSFTTPTLGAATATSINNIALTNPGAAATLTLASGSTLVTSGAFSTTLTSTALTSVTLPTTGTLYGTAAASITSAQLLSSVSDETGTGLAVFATAPTLTGANLAAGTITVDPLTFTSGTNLTTAAAGAMEFDGSAFYATSVASTRQVVVTEQFISNTANFTMANIATAQSVFAAANDVFTLPATTTYFFEGVYNITGMGATTRTTATLFGGTATITSIAYYAMIQTGVANALGTVQSTKNCITAAANVLNATVTTAAATITVKGIVRINAGGTFIPQIQFSANPTGTIIGTTNSWFRMYPVGTNTVAAVGNVN